MKVVTSLINAKRSLKLCIALGNFDGVHLGHQHLIKAVVEKALQVQGTAAILTFYPHPTKIIDYGNVAKKLITNLRKFKLLQEYGVDLIIQLPFTTEFADTKAEDFIKDMAEKLDINHMVVGFNYTFGKGARGNWELLEVLGRCYGFAVQVIPPVKAKDCLVSSTAIRTALSRGDIKQAGQLLGRPPALEGKVISGNKLGRRLGFPTANLEIEEEILLPKTGVYLAQALIDQECFFGVMNIGFRPTITKSLAPVAEIYLLDFDKNIYNRHLEVRLLERLRDEVKFNSENQLIGQINTDIDVARKIISSKYVTRCNST